VLAFGVARARPPTCGYCYDVFSGFARSPATLVPQWLVVSTHPSHTMSSPRQTEVPISPLFTERWSPRALTGEALPREALLALLEAARWSPSASNIQPWRFLYGHAGSPTFAAILGGLVPFNQGWANKASALMVVLSKTASTAPGSTEAKPNAWHAFDAGAAWASLAYQAHLSGWVTHAMGGFDAASLRTALSIPADVAVHAVVAVGRRGDKATLPEGLQAREQPSDRLPLAKVATEGSYNFTD
jgi:nitroreductase